MLNDLGEGIKRDYWSITADDFQPQYFFGTIFETSELITPNVSHPELTYPAGLIALDPGLAIQILQTDPLLRLSAFPILDPNVTNYNIRKRIIRELLQDGDVKVTEVFEFEPS